MGIDYVVAQYLGFPLEGRRDLFSPELTAALAAAVETGVLVHLNGYLFFACTEEILVHDRAAQYDRIDPITQARRGPPTYVKKIGKKVPILAPAARDLLVQVQQAVPVTWYEIAYISY